MTGVCVCVCVLFLSRGAVWEKEHSDGETS